MYVYMCVCVCVCVCVYTYTYSLLRIARQHQLRWPLHACFLQNEFSYIE